MGKKCVVLGLAICLLVSSFHEVSCQVEASGDFNAFEGQSISQSFKEQETSSVSQSVETNSEAVSSQRSSGAEDVISLMKDFIEQTGSNGVKEDAPKLMDSSEMVYKTTQDQVKELEEIQRKMKTTSSSSSSSSESSVLEQEYKASKQESLETTSQDEDVMISQPKKIGREDASTEKITTRSNSFAESLRIGQSGSWYCTNPNPDQNGGTEDDSMVIGKYKIDDILKAEVLENKETKTASLVKSLEEIVDRHKKVGWTDVKLGKTTITERSQKIEELRVTLKQFVGVKVSELVTRSDYEKILTMAARYEELTQASVTYISRLATFGSVIKQGFSASERVETVRQRVTLHEKVATEKQKKVDTEFEKVKALAKKGDSLYVQIYGMKRAVLKLEAEKRQVEINFQKTIQSLSLLLQESTQAYEEHHVVKREWKEVQSHVEYSNETIQKAETVWIQFLSTL